MGAIAFLLLLKPELLLRVAVYVEMYRGGDFRRSVCNRSPC